jgi:hypothetical protein
MTSVGRDNRPLPPVMAARPRGARLRRDEAAIQGPNPVSLPHVALDGRVKPGHDGRKAMRPLTIDCIPTSSFPRRREPKHVSDLAVVSSNYEHAWVPAFAGMTELSGLSAAIRIKSDSRETSPSMTMWRVEA